MKTNWAVKALPATALAITLLAPGCSSSGSDSNCTLKASVDSVSSAADALVRASADMQGKLYVACTKIAGMPDVQASAANDDNVQAACDMATAKIKAEFSAGVSVVYVPGKCEVEAEAQLSCEASCKSDVMCTEPDISVRCEPGKLSVECSGECTGTLSCEGSASVAVKCEGACNGSCSGTCGGTCNGECEGTCSVKDSDGKCAGTCSGTCKGACSAKCTGTCSGSCTYDANASVKCDAKARCEGMCSVAGTAPRCDGEITPPKCSGNASCQGSCEGKAKFNAKCTPPTVTVTGFADADFTTTLTDNLPAVFAVAEQAKVVADGAVTLANSTGQFLGQIGADLQCTAAHLATVTSKLEASAKASVSVSVSVMASANVSGAATTGG